MNRSFLYGDAVFETVRVEGGQARHIERHIARVSLTMQTLGYPAGALDSARAALHALDGKADGLHRLTFVRPEGDEVPEVVHHRRDLTAKVAPRLMLLPGWYLPDDQLAEHKTTSYLRSVEVQRRAMAAGFDDAIRVSNSGLLGETAMRNLLVHSAGVWKTPPVRGILPGTVRASLLDQGLVEEAVLTMTDLESAASLAVTSVAVGVLPAASVGARELSAAPALELAERWIW